MRSEWLTAPLDDLVDDVLDRRGVTPLKLGSAFSSSGHRVISAKLIKDGRVDLSADEPRFVDDATYRRWMKTPLLEGDVIVTSEAPLGETAYVSELREWCLGQRLFAVRPKKDRLVGRYLYYALRSSGVLHDLHSRATGTTVQGIRQPELRRVMIPIPPLEEQRRVADILGALDDKIELNRRMGETLEAMARALFKAWFVDFAPTSSRPEDRGTDTTDAASAPPSDSLEHGSAIAATWPVSRLGDVVGTVLGGTPSRTEGSYWGGDIAWINSGKANEFRVVTPTEFITREGLESSSTKQLPARTTIVAITGATLGQVSLTEIDVCANQSIVGILGSAELASEFIYFWVQENIAHLVAKQTGGAQQHINKRDVDDLPVLCPPERLMAAWVARSRPMFDRIRLACIEPITLASARDALLPKLISGELRVADAERIAVEAGA